MAATVTIDERVRLPATAMSHAGFRAWATSDSFPGGVRATFVDGEVILEMSPEATESHNKVKSCFTAVLGEIASKEDLGEVYGDGVLVTNEEVGLSSEPDTTFISWSTFESERARLIEKASRDDDYVEIVGSPDIVIEILSDGSVRKDTRLLLDAHLRAGVTEYWLVDARGESLSFEILRRSAAGWDRSAPPDQPQRSEVFRRTFSLARTKNRAGRWTYRLDAQRDEKPGH